MSFDVEKMMADARELKGGEGKKVLTVQRKYFDSFLKEKGMDKKQFQASQDVLRDFNTVLADEAVKLSYESGDQVKITCMIDQERKTGATCTPKQSGQNPSSGEAVTYYRAISITTSWGKNQACDQEALSVTADEFQKKWG